MRALIALLAACGSEPAPQPAPKPAGPTPVRVFRVPGEIMLDTGVYFVSRRGQDLTITDYGTGAHRTVKAAETITGVHPCENAKALVELRDPATDDNGNTQLLDLATGAIEPPVDNRSAWRAPCKTHHVSGADWSDPAFAAPKSLREIKGYPDDYRLNIQDEDLTGDNQHVVAKLVVFDRGDVVYADQPPPVGFNSRVGWWSQNEFVMTDLAFRYAHRIEASYDGKVGAVLATAEPPDPYTDRRTGRAIAWAFPATKTHTLATDATAVAVAPDGSWIAAATLNGIDLFRPTDGVRIDRLDTRDRVDRLWVSASGRWLTARGDKTTVWDLRGTRRPRMFDGRVASAPDDSLYTIDPDGNVKVWKPTDDGTILDLAAEDVRISRNGQYVVAQRGKELRRVTVATGSIDRATAANEYATIAVGDTGDAVFMDDAVWSWPLGKPPVELGEHKRPDDQRGAEGRLSKLAVLPDGTPVSAYDFITLWRTPPVLIGAGGAGSYNWDAGIDPITISPDGKWIAIELQHAIRLYDVTKAEYADLEHLYTRIAFAPDSSAFVTGAKNFWNEGGRIWKLPSRDVSTAPTQASVKAVAWSPDGKRIALGGTRLTIYDVATKASTDIGGVKNESGLVWVTFVGADRLGLLFRDHQLVIWDIAKKSGRVVDTDGVLAARAVGDKLLYVTAHAVRETR